MSEQTLGATAECVVCGARVTYFMAPLHVEDHKARGEFPAETVSEVRR